MKKPAPLPNKTPNKATVKAMEQSRAIIKSGKARFKTAEDLFKDIDKSAAVDKNTAEAKAKAFADLMKEPSRYTPRAVRSIGYKFKTAAKAIKITDHVNCAKLVSAAAHAAIVASSIRATKTGKITSDASITSQLSAANWFLTDLIRKSELAGGVCRFMNMVVDGENGQFVIKFAVIDHVSKTVTVYKIVLEPTQGFNREYLNATRSRGQTIEELIQRRIKL